MIQSTTVDIRTQLNEIEIKLKEISQSILRNNHAPSDLQRKLENDKVDLEQILAQREAALQCLGILGNISEHVDRTWFQVIAGERPAGTAAPNTNTSYRRELVYSETSSTMRHVRNRLDDTQAFLKTIIKAADGRIAVETPDDSDAARERAGGETIDVLKRERDNAQKRLAMCIEASHRASGGQIQIVEDIKTGDGGRQALISSSGGRLEARGWSAGAGGFQVIAAVSDQTAKEVLGMILKTQEPADISYEEL